MPFLRQSAAFAEWHDWLRSTLKRLEERRRCEGDACDSETLLYNMAARENCIYLFCRSFPGFPTPRASHGSTFDSLPGGAECRFAVSTPSHICAS
jgi:hypothetical protein